MISAVVAPLGRGQSSSPILRLVIRAKNHLLSDLGSEQLSPNSFSVNFLSVSSTNSPTRSRDPVSVKASVDEPRSMPPSLFVTMTFRVVSVTSPLTSSCRNRAIVDAASLASLPPGQQWFPTERCTRVQAQTDRRSNRRGLKWRKSGPKGQDKRNPNEGVTARTVYAKELTPIDCRPGLHSTRLCLTNHPGSDYMMTVWRRMTLGLLFGRKKPIPLWGERMTGPRPLGRKKIIHACG